MASGYDVAYVAGVVLAAPYWVLRAGARRKVMGALRKRMGEVERREGDGPCVMIHAVSLGEMNATRALVRKLGEARPELEFVISTTTETGFGRGMELYGADDRVRVIRYPLDFSWAVGRVLDRVRPAAVVLMELEVWPNFMRECERRGIPVVLVNGRVTESSYRGYRLIRPVAGRMLRRLAKVCVQDEVYAERFVRLGAPRERVMVTGTMKFDTAEVGEGVEGDVELAAAVGLGAEGSGFRVQGSGGEGKDKETRRQGDKGTDNADSLSPCRHVPLSSSSVWVCGSTGPGEEEMVLGVYRRLWERFGGLRLVVVPRKPERFDEVAEVIRGEGFGVVRRSARRVQGSGFGVQEGQDKATRGQGEKETGRVQEGQDKGTRGQGDKETGRVQGGKDKETRGRGDKGTGVGDAKCVEGGILNPEPRTLNPVILGDTMGELRKFYCLADVVFVGRSLVDLGPRQHGSDMIEPAALGKPVVVGPFTGNFADAMMKLRAAGAVREVRDAGELEAAVGELLSDRDGALEMGRRGQEVVRREQGATDRHVRVVLEVMGW